MKEGKINSFKVYIKVFHGSLVAGQELYPFSYGKKMSF